MIGKLKHCVEIHSVSTTQDAYGERIETYAKYMSTFMSIVPLRGQEYLQSQQVTAKIAGKAEMRYDSRVSPKDRILYNDGNSTRTLEINAVINVKEENRFLELWYTEIDT